MSGDLINLRRVRKAKARSVAADVATVNRAKYGSSGAERRLVAAQSALAARRLDEHRLEDIASRDAD